MATETPTLPPSIAIDRWSQQIEKPPTKRVILVDLISAGKGNAEFYRLGEFIAKDEFTACRVLASRGFAGTMETYRPGATYPSMRIDIEAGARLAVSETSQQGPRYAKWRPFPEARLPVNRSNAEAVSGAGVMPPP